MLGDYGTIIYENQPFVKRQMALKYIIPKNLHVPVSLPHIEETTFESINWDVLTPSSERKLIDDAVFDVLGLTQGERDAVYEGVTELVENRRRRARSV